MISETLFLGRSRAIQLLTLFQFRAKSIVGKLQNVCTRCIYETFHSHYVFFDQITIYLYFIIVLLCIREKMGLKLVLCYRPFENQLIRIRARRISSNVLRLNQLIVNLFDIFFGSLKSKILLLILIVIFCETY